MRVPLALIVALALLVTGCSQEGGGKATQTAAVAGNFSEFRTGYCAAWVHLLTAVGNPDTASGSDMTRAMEAAITGRDQAGVDRVATQIKTELENGRVDVAYSAGWKPAAGLMTHFDRLFVAYEVYTETEASTASMGLQMAKDKAQAAFLEKGADDAWRSLFDPDTSAPIRSALPQGWQSQQCPGVPVSV